MEESSTTAERQTMTVTEAAETLGISRANAYALAKRGELPGAIRLGGRVVVSKTALARAIDASSDGRTGQ